MLVILVLLVLLYPAYMLFRAHSVLSFEEVRAVEESILNYQLSIWISWILLASVAVFYKWTDKGNFFFYFTYAFLCMSFALYGYLHQDMINRFNLPSSFSDNYTLGILTAFQNIISSVILTAFLQGAVWWFTRRWYRR